MSLEIPTLDDREFQDILEDAITRIPVHEQEWTDHNRHDPGITILETLAWIAETEIYQLDRITETHLKKYLALLGVRPRAPLPATARLHLTPAAPTTGTTVEPNTPVEAEDPDGRITPFETTDAVVLTRARIERVIAEHHDGRSDHTAANTTPGRHYPVFGNRAARGSSLYLGFDDDPFGAGSLDLFVDYYDDDLPPPATHGDEQPDFEPTVRVAWEHCTNYDRWYRDDTWEPVEVLHDDTIHLYAGGTIRLARPFDWDATAVGILDQEAPYAWLRCRLDRPGYEIPPRVRSFSLNVLTACHRTRRSAETLVRPTGEEETTGRPRQVFVFSDAPVRSAAVRVGGERWEPVRDFDASGPDDHHYVLNPARGEVRFGDGIRGKPPAPDQRVVADTVVYGGGRSGNVPRSAQWRFTDDALAGAVDVTAPAGATGGRDAESVTEAVIRLRRDLETPYRAVTPADYEYVATHTPGLRFGRATAVVESETHPGCTDRKTVRVVVVPHSTRPRPVPSEGFLDAVRIHLERHRLLTDRVTVEPPRYVGIGVRAAIGILPGYAAEDRAGAVEHRLDEYLHPLEGYAGEGWPFGRPLHRSDLYETIEAVEGVDCVFGLRTTATGHRGVDDEGTVLIPETALVYPADHTVVVTRDHADAGRK